jgi:uncharacterized protein (DUF2267 family)
MADATVQTMLDKLKTANAQDAAKLSVEIKKILVKK